MTPAVRTPVRIAALECLTAFGDAASTHAALLRGETALRPVPVLGEGGGDECPIALTGPMTDDFPPRWMPALQRFDPEVRSSGWGRPRTPVLLTSSNFGVDGLITHLRKGSPGALRRGVVSRCAADLRQHYGWGENVTVVSHACVSAQLGLMQAARLLAAGEADRALVFSFDFASAFVAGGFHALKILNRNFPAPYADREYGAIGIGDGAGYAVLTRDEGDFAVAAQHCHNEMWHFTANDPSGEGFRRALAPFAASGMPGKVWFKGHGTGTLEPGKLEAEAAEKTFPGAPIVGWKGSLGHTLGSCALVELALGVESMRLGVAPGTVGTSGKCFSDNVATAPFSTAPFDGAVMACNAFGGAHAAMLITPHA